MTIVIKDGKFDFFLNQEPIIQDPEQELLAFLDRGVSKSLWFSEIPEFVDRLAKMAAIDAYPHLSEVPPIKESLSFLHTDITEACLCVIDRRRRVQWYGKNALDRGQFWSATKFLPLLYLGSVVEALEDCYSWEITAQITDRKEPDHIYSFAEMVRKIFTYEDQHMTSNSLAAMFKTFSSPEVLENWLKALTGNHNLIFRGGYGELPFLSKPILQEQSQRLLAIGDIATKHQGENLVSAYDLTRCLSQWAWQRALPPDRCLVLPNCEVLVEAMAQDTARYIDVALDYLDIQKRFSEVVILSKMGFGWSESRHRSEITYTALFQANNYACCMTVRGKQALDNPAQEAIILDARMAAEITKLIDWTMTLILQ